MEKNDTKTAAPVKQDPLLVEAKKYLDARAAEDPQFAEKYANPKKSVEECVKYLYGEAYARAAGGKCVYISPDEIFGLAVHYYDEENIKINRLPAGTRATTAPKPKAELTEDERKRAKAEALAEIKAQAKAEAKQKEKARKEAEKARQREKKEAYRRQLEADGDLFATL